MLLSKTDIVKALTRLGEIAASQGQQIQLLVVGGAAMALAYEARVSTKDIDAIFLTPPEASQTRQWAAEVATEFGFDDDWLNDGAKGFIHGLKQGALLLDQLGIRVWQIAPEQLLAMKLTAWRDDVDIEDSKRLLLEFRNLTLEDVWSRVEPFLIPNQVQKARYALEDAWSDEHL
jgi:Nucleotidyltransferase of unknown function (DUF6036)